MKTKICFGCKKEKDITEFNKNKSKKDGLCVYCKICDRKFSREYSKKNRDKMRRYGKRYRRNKPIENWCSTTITRHRAKGYEVLFTSKDLLSRAKQINICPICNTRLGWKFGKGTRQNNSPSLDRINNENFLTLDNTQIICWLCNASKQNRTMKEFIEYCEMVYQKFGTLVVIPINLWIDRNIDKNRKDYGDSDIGIVKKIDLSKKIEGEKVDKFKKICYNCIKDLKEE